MHSLLAFMERWREGSTADVQAASYDQIAALVEPLDRGWDALPRVYLDFLETMGEHTGELRLIRGTTSVSELLAEREFPDKESVDPNHYFKYGTGEDDYNGRQPDDFLDLHRKTPDGGDARMLRIREEILVKGNITPDEPFGSFSDLVRAVVVSNFCLWVDPNHPAASFGFGSHVDAPARVYAFLAQLGFELTELGASPSMIPLENPQQQAIALLCGPTSDTPRTLLLVRTPDEKDGRRLAELIADYREKLRGFG
jgi:hypothetical protein